MRFGASSKDLDVTKRSISSRVTEAAPSLPFAASLPTRFAMESTTRLRTPSFISASPPKMRSIFFAMWLPSSCTASGMRRSVAKGLRTPEASVLSPRPAFSEMYSTRPAPSAMARAWSMRSLSPVCRAWACAESWPRTAKSRPLPVAAETTGHVMACEPSCRAPRTGASTKLALSASLRAFIFPPRTVPSRASVPTPPNIEDSQRSAPSSAPSPRKPANLSIPLTKPLLAYFISKLFCARAAMTFMTSAVNVRFSAAAPPSERRIEALTASAPVRFPNAPDAAELTNDSVTSSMTDLSLPSPASFAACSRMMPRNPLVPRVAPASDRSRSSNAVLRP